MLVLTNVEEKSYSLRPGDTFQITMEQGTSKEVVLSEEITKQTTINFLALFRFALDDGTCQGRHTGAFMGNKCELPEEIRNAKLFSELTQQQQQNFHESSGVTIYGAV